MTKQLCACGCGQEIEPKPWHKKKPALFVRYHHLSVGDRTPRYTPKPEEIPSGLCECGCGGKTTIATETHVRLRRFKGYPQPFIVGHHARMTAGRMREYTKTRFDAILTVAQAAYIAGIVDGEGSIQIRQNSFRVAIFNTNPDIIEWMSGFGGNATEAHSVAGRRPVYRWSIGSRQAVETLLRQIEPYMIIKKERACTVLAMIDMLNQSKHDLLPDTTVTTTLQGFDLP